MKIGIIGSGAVGQTLGKAFLHEGFAVMLGTRDPQKAAVVKWKEENPLGNTGTFSEAAKFGEMIVLATAGEGAEEAVKLAGIENFTKKTVIDTTNPIKHEPPANGVLRYFTNMNKSLMESIQELIPDAYMVKAFNSVGSGMMYRPDFKGIKPTMFICGANAGAKLKVTELLEDFGWETEDMGAIDAAGSIEALCMLWCIPGLARNQWTHAFKLLKQ